MELLPFIVESNEWCSREIAGRENAVWVDVFNPMLEENGAPRGELFVADGLHLSRAGYELWREILRREVTWLGE
jgi:lysophospholipase L1-like esterase